MKKFLIAIFAMGLLAAFVLAKSKLSSGSQEVSAQSRTLYLYAMSDYFPRAVIQKFEKDNNCTVKYDNFSNNEELLAKLQAGGGGYDLIVPSDYIVQALVAENLIVPLDKSKISNLKNIAPEFLNKPYDPESKFTVPYTWGTTGLVYNSKYVKGPVDSWDVLFDKSYSGHVALLDDEREVLGAMLHKLGYSSNTTNKDELKQAQKLLVELKSQVRLFASDPKQQILSGDVWIAHIFSGDAQQIIRSNPDLHYVVPKEGGMIWIDNLAVPKDSQNADLAHAFINTILEKETAKQITEELLYSSPNRAIENLVEEQSLKPSHLKATGTSRLEFLKDLGAEAEHWDRLWTEAKAH
jgi:spermidine/putrescine transport system substrate-binding protein